MDNNILLGIITLIITIGVSSYLVFWSRHIINRIDRKGPDTARKIVKEIIDGG